jgi:hypothetical protein
MEYHLHIENLSRSASNGLVYEVDYCFETYQNGYFAHKKGLHKISGSHNDPNFINFYSLTPEDVKGWITGSLPISTWQTEVSTSLALLENNTYSTGIPDNFTSGSFSRGFKVDYDS